MPSVSIRVYYSLSVVRFVFVRLCSLRIKTNLTTDREQYTRSNAATAKVGALPKAIHHFAVENALKKLTSNPLATTLDP